MRPLFAAAAVLIVALPSGAALAQVAPYPQVPAPYLQPNVTTGDIHRYEMDRLRAQADQNQALAQSQTLQTQLTLQSLQAQRQPPLVTQPTRRPLSLDEARQQRQAIETRSGAATHATGQIDSWLDRRPQ